VGGWVWLQEKHGEVEGGCLCITFFSFAFAFFDWNFALVKGKYYFLLDLIQPALFYSNLALSGFLLS